MGSEAPAIFGLLCLWKLGQIAIDEFVRRRLGRSGEKRAIVFADSIEDLSERDQLEPALAAGAGDGCANSAADLGWLHPDRDREADAAARAR